MIRRGTVALLGVLALAAILRLWGLEQPLWPDEALGSTDELYFI